MTDRPDRADLPDHGGTVPVEPTADFHAEAADGAVSALLPRIEAIVGPMPTPLRLAFCRQLRAALVEVAGVPLAELEPPQPVVPETETERLMREARERIAADFPEPLPVRNRELTSAMIPSPTASWETIADFALSFSGYQWVGFNRCAEIMQRREMGTLTELRAGLFFLQRSVRHGGWGPSKEELAYARAVVRPIRARVRLVDELLA